MAYTFNNGYWYEADDSGNIIYSSKFSDVEGTLSRDVETGKMVDDLSLKLTSYTIDGYNTDNLEKTRLTQNGRRNKRKSIKYLIGKKNVLTPFEQELGNGDLKRRDFRDENFIQLLADKQYVSANYDAIKPGKGLYLAKSYAQNVRNVVYPQLQLKIRKGNFVKTRKDIIGLKPGIRGCISCGTFETGFLKIKIGERDGYEWVKPLYKNMRGSVSENITYGQKPEIITEYASPVELISKSSTETKPEAESIKKPTRKLVNRSSGTYSKPIKGVTYKKPTTNTQSATNTQRTTTWKELPDGTIVDIVVGDWENIK